MADVEALDPRRHLRQPQQVAQGFGPRPLRAAAGQLVGQRELGIALHQLQVRGTLAAHVHAQRDLAVRVFRQRAFHQLAVGDVVLQHDLRRRRLLGVVLRHECSQHVLATVRAIGLREERPGAEVAPVAEGQQHHARRGALHRHRQYVEVGAAAIHGLPRLGLADAGNQVPQARGLFEIQRIAGRLHRRRELVGQLLAAPFQEQGGAAHRIGIGGGIHQPYARRAATTDLVLQARPAAVVEHAVFATAQAEQLVHQVERFAHRAGAWVWAEVAPWQRARAAMVGQPWPGLLGQHDAGVALVVAQQHVVARLQRLDQLVLQQQRIGLAAGDGGFHPRHLRQHPHDPRRFRRGVEVAPHAVAQGARLAYVEHAAGVIEHAIHARRQWQRGGEGAAVERSCLRLFAHAAPRMLRSGPGAPARRCPCRPHRSA